jgi:hypothetical protein
MYSLGLQVAESMQIQSRAESAGKGYNRPDLDSELFSCLHIFCPKRFEYLQCSLDSALNWKKFKLFQNVLRFNRKKLSFWCTSTIEILFRE